jgi:AIG2-like family
MPVAWHFHTLRVPTSTTTSLAESRPQPDAQRQAPLLHFSYGANMNSGVLRKRGVAPLSVAPAFVSDDTWCLSFSHRGGFATLLPCSAVHVTAVSKQCVLARPHGVLYGLRPEDMQALQRNETGYDVATISVRQYGTSEDVQALCFRSSPLLTLRAPLAPTDRYLNLLKGGARERGLSPDYCALLEAVPTLPASGLPAQYFDTPSDKVAGATIAAFVFAIGLLFLR